MLRSYFGLLLDVGNQGFDEDFILLDLLLLDHQFCLQLLDFLGRLSQFLEPILESQNRILDILPVFRQQSLIIIQKIQVILGSGVGNSFQLQLEVLRIPLHRGVHSHNMRNYILFVLLRQAFLLQVVVGDALQRILRPREIPVNAGGGD